MSAILSLNFLILYRNDDFELIPHLHKIYSSILWANSPPLMKEEELVVDYIKYSPDLFSWTFYDSRFVLNLRKVHFESIFDYYSSWTSLWLNSINQRQWYELWMALAWLGRVTIRLKYVHMVSPEMKIKL